MEAFERARNDLDLVDGQFESLKQILKFHLDHSYFSFEDKYFRQKTGLPIGSAIGGPIACLALALEEDRLLEKLQQSNRDLAHIFQFYRRYLDDSILMFGAKSEDKAKEVAETLLHELKNMHVAFDFTTTLEC
jgi:hypothetical protein